MKTQQRPPAIGIPPQRERTTVEQEIQWLKENYRLEKPLLVESLIIALKQRIKRVDDPDKLYWAQVVSELIKLKQ